jgi:glycosyltransferase involved in cell wall biosynthesis
VKIGAILDNMITTGGGFNQALNAVLQMSRICKDKYEFSVYTSIAQNVEYLNRLGVDAKRYKVSLVDKTLAYTATNSLLRRIQNKQKLIGSMEKRLLSDHVDLVYFATPTTRSILLQKLNYIATIWDLSHRDSPEFPEVRIFNQFLSTEYTCSNTLAQALTVICDSTTLADRLSYRYGIDQNRLMVMPYSPSPFTEHKHAMSKAEILEKYRLDEGYYFYPAQFWAHKNHVRLLQAYQLLLKNGAERQLVFCGSDQGNLSHVKSVTSSLHLDQHVHFLGFVPSEDIRGLYEGACAVLMPSYFGPTNLPPLEAWKLEVPLVYSSCFADHAGNAAILANPDSATEWAEAMNKVLDKETACELVHNGTKRLRDIEEERVSAELKLRQCMDKFSKRLECWKG